MDPQQLFQRLSAALATNPAVRDRLTIGDLYQRLIPYRLIRNELGVMELAAYEHALLRLLAGEGRHLEIENARALDEFRRELASVNPILGVYRDYADVGVRLSGSPPHPVPEPFGGEGEGEMEGETPTAAIDEADVTSELRATSPSFSRATDVPAPKAYHPRPERCECCGAVLPELPGVRFCPYCGEARPRRPCTSCGTLLEPDWKYCIRCGDPPAGALSA